MEEWRAQGQGEVKMTSGDPAVQPLSIRINHHPKAGEAAAVVPLPVAMTSSSGVLKKSRRTDSLSVPLPFHHH